MSDALMGSALLQAYTEYLERMFTESDELVDVDIFTVPADVNPDSPVLSEWADIN
jgi:hypothetical protein